MYRKSYEVIGRLNAVKTLLDTMLMHVVLHEDKFALVDTSHQEL